MRRRYCTLDQARRLIQDADVLLYRAQGVFTLIALAGRGEHSHAAAAVQWRGGELMAVEMDIHGGHAVTLASQVKRYPGRIDLYRVKSDPYQNSPFDRQAAAVAMIRKCGNAYGWLGIFLSLLIHLPIIRLITRPSLAQAADGDHPTRPEFCSQAISHAHAAGGGIDPVPGLAHRHTEPADLARSAAYEYAATLTSNDAQTWQYSRHGWNHGTERLAGFLRGFLRPLRRLLCSTPTP